MTRNVTLCFLVLALLAGVLGAQEIIFETNGDLAPGDRLSSDGSFEDVYRIGVSEGTTIEVVIESEDFDSYVEAVLPSGRRVQNDDFDGLNAGFIQTIERSGTMQLSVQSLFGSDSGAYRVIVRRATEAQEILVGADIRGRLGADGEFGTQARFSLAGRSGQRVIIELMSDDFDSFLELTDSFGQQYTNDDGGEGLNSRLVYTFEDNETVTVVARALFGETEGNFELSVRESSQELRSSISGSLTATDQRGYDGTIFDRVEVEAVEGESLSFVLRSRDFDSYLWLSDPDGVSIASDDDSGGGRDSAIDIEIERSGTYVLFITSFFDALGDWELETYQ